MNKKYEMHIYTMGTRSYAVEVAKILDPDHSLFKERILSRDESGSFSIKSIKRLFPCDQSMVVVVDDRSDIWDWSPNLIHVNACKLFFRMYILDNFFQGIGDINAPKPLLAASNETSDSEVVENDHSGRSDSTLAEISAENSGKIEFKHTDDDIELNRITWMLNKIHGTFYAAVAGGKMPDVGQILPEMKQSVLKDVKIVFSGIIPLGVDPTKYVTFLSSLLIGSLFGKRPLNLERIYPKKLITR